MIIYPLRCRGRSRIHIAIGLKSKSCDSVLKLRAESQRSKSSNTELSTTEKDVKTSSKVEVGEVGVFDNWLKD
jgi:hypothetical protein